MANLLDSEDERGSQLQLLDEDEDISSISPSFVGFFQPLTHSFFQEPDEGQFGVDDGVSSSF